VLQATHEMCIQAAINQYGPVHWVPLQQQQQVLRLFIGTLVSEGDVLLC
jgi:hypothetical protein